MTVVMTIFGCHDNGRIALSLRLRELASRFGF
jgi:hypothetical protein